VEPGLRALNLHTTHPKKVGKGGVNEFRDVGKTQKKKVEKL
jgi:hypothetical protein